MTWTVLKWAWRVKSPLFIGMPPAGSLNRTRLYVPSRVVHGAVTSELARMNGDEKSIFPDYGKFGHEVGENCRFTYLYPARKNGDKYLVWTPGYVKTGQDVNKRDHEQKRGLHWYCHDIGESLSYNDFRCRLLVSMPGTAIDPLSDSASEGTLRETECISPWWRYPNHSKKTDAVFLLGYVFMRNNSFQRQLCNVDTLFVGGDTRYGLGKITCVDSHKENNDSLSVFGGRVSLDSEQHPVIHSQIAFGHAPEDIRLEDKKVQGVKELLGGWDIDKFIIKSAWVPGSMFEKEVSWSIDNYGYWAVLMEGFKGKAEPSPC